MNADSPYLKMFNEFVGVTASNANARRAFQTLCTIYKVEAGNVNVNDEVAKYTNEMKELSNRYPLLGDLSRYSKPEAIAEYINAIDAVKGI